MNTRSTLKIVLPLAAGIGLGFLLIKSSVFGSRDTPEPDYTTIAKLGAEEEAEIRQYRPMILASTAVEATSYKDASGKAFRRLADYIFGSNVQDEEIGMTAPVYQKAQARDGEEIGMTAPVFQNKKDGTQWVMSFVMPKRYTMETLPKPKDDAIDLEKVPAKTLAVLRFSGSLDEKLAAKKTRELEALLARSPWKPLSPARSAGYDPPFTIPFFRRNEVLIEVGK